MERAIHKTGLCLFLVVSISFLYPWTLGCADSASKTKVSKQSVSVAPGRVEAKPQNDESDCVRGEPEPVLKNSEFRRLTRLTAEEQYSLNDNVSLVIKHFGCAHFAQTYRFRIKGVQQNKEDWRYWMDNTADFFDDLPFQDHSTRNGRIASVLRAQAKSASPYEYNTEISISEAEFLTFDAKSVGKDAIEIVVSYEFVL